tara:strand:- start:7653 stop:8279 length:627 start_codon:yes stop_codon:yes gene_type:complete
MKKYTNNLKGMHPVAVRQQSVKNEIWEDAAWYNEDTNHFFVPIWRNASTFFMKMIAEQFDYRLVKNYEVVDWQNVPAYTFIRSPDKRFAGQYWKANTNNDIEVKDLKETDDWSSLDMHFVHQHTFIEQYNIVHCVDLDNPMRVHDDGIFSVINNVVTIMNTQQEIHNAISVDFKKANESELSSNWFIEKHASYYKDDYKLYKDYIDGK